MNKSLICLWQIVSLTASVALLILGMGSGSTALTLGDPPPLSGICSESDRFGLWDTGHRIQRYDVSHLHSGWYISTRVHAGRDPPRLAGMIHANLVRISGDGPYQDRACTICPTWEQVRWMARTRPGSLWFIGNEPDRQDYVSANRYAELYHDFYTFLKVEDPTCQVAIGGVVQPTPIRLQYLDMILNAYQDLYGRRMPVDVWNVHNYVLREGATGWGCGIPPGTDETLAIEYGIQDNDNVSYWKAHIVAMREWMRDRGYRDRPLVISEYGTLMPELYGFDQPRVESFMLDTFAWLVAATDTKTGYQADGNRLVQGWVWYSLDEDDLEGFPTRNHLFDPDTRTITELGKAFGAYTESLSMPFPGSVDLNPAAVRLAKAQLGAAGLITATVTAEIYNAGASPAHSVLVRFERDGTPAGEVTTSQVLPGTTQHASVIWPNLVPAVYQVQVHVDPDAQIVECDRFNNSRSVPLLVGQSSPIYLPVLRRN